MPAIPDEIRLLWLLLLNAFVWFSTYRFVLRRVQTDRWAAAGDALLLSLLIQYISICLPGLLGMLNAATMSATAVAIGSGLLWYSIHVAEERFLKIKGTGPFSSTAEIKGPRSFILPYAAVGERGPRPFNFSAYLVAAPFLVVCGYLLAYGWLARDGAVLANDPLTYHLNAADHWLRTGRLSIYTTWFFNPANTYSPLAGSTFMAWLIAPLGNDVAVRYVELPALLLIYLSMLDLCRSLGTDGRVAALIAAGAVLSRPFISQALLVKDDAFLAAFFLAAVAGCAKARLTDRLGPWRVGAAIGLFLATKYTALLSVPIFLLLIDAPFRAGWTRKRWGIALGTIALVAGPWFVRNWIVSGNPIFPIPVSIAGQPIFDGLFVAERSTDMRTLSGAWRAAAGMYHSPSTTMLSALALAWIGSIVTATRTGIWKDPIGRLCIVGPAVGLAIFFIASHAAEIRYAYPSLLLLLVCCGMMTLRLPTWIGLIAAIVIACIAVYGGFEAKEVLASFIVAGLVFAVVVCGIVELNARLPRSYQRLRYAIVLTSALLASGYLYVSWPAYLTRLRIEFTDSWNQNYGSTGKLWEFVSDNLPPNSPIAYTNAFVIYPLIGFDHTRTLTFVPARKDLQSYHDLPRSRTLVSDQHIRAFMANLINAGADWGTWLESLHASRADFLFIGKQADIPLPLESTFADFDATHFVKVFENESGAIYKINWF